MIAEKQCLKCKETKLVKYFTRVLYKGYRAWCKDCVNKKERARREVCTAAIQAATSGLVK